MRYACALVLLMSSLQVHAVDPPKKYKNPVHRSLAIYMPEEMLDSFMFIPQMGAAYSPGRALQSAAVDAGNYYFDSAQTFDPKSGATFALVLAVHPAWEDKQGNATLKIKYSLLDGDGQVLASGEKSNDISAVKLLMDNAFYSMSLSVMKDILSDEDLTAKATAPATAAAAVTAAKFAAEPLVSREKPAKTGTGFFINDHGQVLTAAHVVSHCPITEIKTDGKTVKGTVVARSLLLDLAVIDTGIAAPHSIPLRAGTSFNLGESVTGIGFPLDGVLAASPNVTKGNISSRAALAGAVGQFQFSAPVQPGSSGGPLVSDGGELLGVTVGTLAMANLVKSGVVPQNVNFALDARYAATFMDHNKVTYVSVPANRKSEMTSPVEAALPAVVQLTCYE